MFEVFLYPIDFLVPELPKWLVKGIFLALKQLLVVGYKLYNIKITQQSEGPTTTTDSPSQLVCNPPSLPVLALNGEMSTMMTMVFTANSQLAGIVC
jgi:hypothetical protein